ncbi:uncharacterized protein [Procambarus clarkii]|uniref:uncharacterized protein n=1 Tax=Procambarus clarkii TaxID=6728 RepID=UPI003743BD44
MDFLRRKRGRRQLFGPELHVWWREVRANQSPTETRARINVDSVLSPATETVLGSLCTDKCFAQSRDININTITTASSVFGVWKSRLRETRGICRPCMGRRLKIHYVGNSAGWFRNIVIRSLLDEHGVHNQLASSGGNNAGPS